MCQQISLRPGVVFLWAVSLLRPLKGPEIEKVREAPAPTSSVSPSLTLSQTNRAEDLSGNATAAFLLRADRPCRTQWPSPSSPWPRHVTIGSEASSPSSGWKLGHRTRGLVNDYTGFPEEVTAAAQICAPMRTRCRCGPRCRKRPTQSTRRSSRRSISRRA